MPKAKANTISAKLNYHDPSISTSIRGQAYDGAAVMYSEIAGVYAN